MKSDEKWWKVGFMLSSGALVLDLNGLEEKRAEEYLFGGKQKHEDVQVSNKKVEELGFMQWSLGLIVEQWENLIFFVLEKKHVRSNLGKLWSELLLSRVGMVPIVILRSIWQQ